jgi:hypothetical protein
MAAVFDLATGAATADFPKEGKFKGTYTSVGTFKMTKIGDDRSSTFFKPTGLVDHMTFHCWGTNEVVSGEASNSGYCVATDPAVDMLEVKFANEKHPSGKPAKGTDTYLAGTGKFTGISGSVAYEADALTFRPITEGTSGGVITLEGHYKVP